MSVDITAVKKQSEFVHWEQGACTENGVTQNKMILSLFMVKTSNFFHIYHKGWLWVECKVKEDQQQRAPHEFLWWAHVAWAAPALQVSVQIDICSSTCRLGFYTRSVQVELYTEFSMVEPASLIHKQLGDLEIWVVAKRESQA
jgi:hypothetical protein